MMEWIYVGMLLGSLVSSSHPTQEACEGRKVMLEKKSVVGQCIQVYKASAISGSIQWYSNSN